MNIGKKRERIILVKENIIQYQEILKSTSQGHRRMRLNVTNQTLVVLVLYTHLQIVNITNQYLISSEVITKTTTCTIFSRLLIMLDLKLPHQRTKINWFNKMDPIFFAQEGIFANYKSNNGTMLKKKFQHTINSIQKKSF